MKLIDLNPRWFAEQVVPPTLPRHGQGITFSCPLCRDMRLGVAFVPPLDGGAPIGPPRGTVYRNGVVEVVYGEPPKLWQRTGETFETLTLSPSVDVSQVKRREGESDGSFAQRNRPCAAGGEQHWHGLVQNGELN